MSHALQQGRDEQLIDDIVLGQEDVERTWRGGARARKSRGGRRCFGERQLDRKGGALPFRRADRDASAHALDEAPADCEPKARSAARTCGLTLDEGLKQALLQGRGDTLPLVFDEEGDGLPPVRSGGGRAAHTYLALLAELDGIAEEVAEYLLKPNGIAAQPQGAGRRGIESKGQPAQ